MMRRLTAIAMFLALVCASCNPRSQPASRTAAQAPAESFRFAALSDTHFSSPAALTEFRNFLHALRAEGGVDFVVILGDICGHAPEYLPLAKNIAETSGLTVYGIPGNHDDNYGRSPHWYQDGWGPARYSFDHKGWHFIMYSDDDKSDPWLIDDLAAVPADRPIVFCRHYPPGRSPEAAEAEPWKTLAGLKNVRLALCGHRHVEDRWTVGGVKGMTLAASFFRPARLSPWYLFEAAAGEITLIRKANVFDLPAQAIADSPPIVAVSHPKDGDTLAGWAEFSGQAEDDRHVQTVEHSIDFGPWRPATALPGRWTVPLDTRALDDGHHVVSVRARDSGGQLSPRLASVLVDVRNAKVPFNGLRLRQGLNGYAGCTDLTVRRGQPGEQADPADADLECWVSAAGAGEFSEFYIRFDTAGVEPPAEAKVKRAELVLFCSRQNGIGQEERPSAYFVGPAGGPWSRQTTFATRPASPRWLAEEQPSPAPAIRGNWSRVGDRQDMLPPKPVRVDLTPMRDEIQQWLDQPESNHGVVVSPAPRPDPAYNQSFASSRHPVGTLRPTLEIEFETQSAASSQPD